MIVTTADLFRVAYGKFAAGAYNINNMEQAIGLFRGHLQAQAPFIIQISKGARKYAGVKMLEAIIRACDTEFSEAIYAVHLDHGDEKTCYDCIDAYATQAPAPPLIPRSCAGRPARSARFTLRIAGASSWRSAKYRT